MDSLVIDHDCGVSYFCTASVGIFFNKEKRKITLYGLNGQREGSFELSGIKSLRANCLVMQQVLREVLNDWGCHFGESVEMGGNRFVLNH